MKILEINKFYNSKRGADKHFMDVIALLEKSGHEIAVFSMAQKGEAVSRWNKYFLSDVGYQKTYSLWKKLKGFGRIYSFEAHRKINLLLDEFKPEIVHVHNIYHQMDPTILFEIKKRNIPIVMTVHDFKLINPNHSLRLNGKPYERCRNGKYWQCFFDKCVKNSYFMSMLAMLEMYFHKYLGTYSKNVDCYIAPSDFVKKTLIEGGISNEKIVVLPHFILPSKNLDASNTKIDNESYAIYAGKISKEKGIDTLFEIFKNITGMKLYLAGEVGEDIIIPDSPQFKYLGFIDEKKLQSYMKNSKCVVSASELPETFGLTALEALSVGIPFVGFNTGAHAEIIRDGIDGFLVNSKSEMKIALEKIASKEAIFDFEKIYNRVQNFNPEKYERNLLNVFNECIENQPK